MTVFLQWHKTVLPYPKYGGFSRGFGRVRPASFRPAACPRRGHVVCWGGGLLDGGRPRLQGPLCAGPPLLACSALRPARRGPYLSSYPDGLKARVQVRLPSPTPNRGVRTGATGGDERVKIMVAQIGRMEGRTTAAPESAGHRDVRVGQTAEIVVVPAGGGRTRRRMGTFARRWPSSEIKVPMPQGTRCRQYLLLPSTGPPGCATRAC